jgi:hypothetical protein
MAQGNGVSADQDFLHQQSQNLLSDCDVQRFGPNPQLGSESRQVLGQL